MRNSQNTWFPSPTEIKTVVDALAEERLDVHTVQIQLNNGTWRVRLEATDADMQDAVVEGTLTNNGAVVTGQPELAS